MKSLRALAALLLLAACGSGGPPPPDWKTDSADLVARYQKYALLGENTLAVRYFQQAVAATGGAGRVAETAHLWLVRCGIRRAMLIDDTCTEYAELARMAPSATDQAYYRFITLRWEDLDPALLPPQHRDVLRAPTGRRSETLDTITDPLARLLDASLLVMRQEADAATLVIATETASSQGWRQPLLTFLKLQREQAVARGDRAEQAWLDQRIRLVETSFFPPPR